MPSSRWDSFGVGELHALAEGIEAAYFSCPKVDVALWGELLSAMDARGAGTEREREEMQDSLREARGPLSARITMVEGQPPYHRMRKGT
jgi:hypothetical protein